jgi:hypothetical protein
MTLAEEGNRIRLEIVRLGDARARRYPPALQDKILDWVERSKQSGMGERECADMLDVPRKRFATWRAERAAPSSKELVPVEVREERELLPFGPSIAFVAPSGFRVEGITLAEAMALLRAFA